MEKQFEAEKERYEEQFEQNKHDMNN